MTILRWKGPVYGIFHSDVLLCLRGIMTHRVVEENCLKIKLSDFKCSKAFNVLMHSAILQKNIKINFK